MVCIPYLLVPSILSDYYSHGQPNTVHFISWEWLVEILLFLWHHLQVEKRSQLHIFLVFIGEKVGVARILRSFSKLCVPLFGFWGSKLTLALKISFFGQLCKQIISGMACGNSSFKMRSCSACKKESFAYFPKLFRGQPKFWSQKMLKHWFRAICSCQSLLHLISLKFLQSGKFLSIFEMPKKGIVWTK